MSALGVPVLINPNKSYWLSSIGTDVIHSTIVTDTIDANVGNFSTLNTDVLNASTLNVSSLNASGFDVSGMYVSSIRGNTAFFSTVTLASDLSGGVGYVRFSVDASGIQVDGDPIRFDNLVYLTSTINIVQVSTIVDTDIFAQRGFFSTLSSGVADIKQGLFSSIICYDISGQNGSFDRLFVSSLEALDISGVSASNWSLFPTLNSSITFQSSYVLSNVGPSLYFAGVELTDVSGGGQDWSRFPAISTVNMNNNSMGGLSTLTYQDGGRLYSVTGNNLFYNGQQINSGAGGAASNWAQYPANNNVNINGSNLSNAALIAGSNLTLSGSNITNGNTFTNSLGVGGTSLLSLATIDSGGDITCRNLDVGDSTTQLADVAIYGVNALPGDNALYVNGGTTLTGGGIVHGAEIGALTVAGIDTVRIDVLPAGMGLNSATYIQLAAAGAGSFAAGGALSLAGGDYVEVNTDDFRVVNTTSGNQSTTLTVANIQMPASVAATVPLQINNTAGGGINLVGTSGVGQIAGFSSIAGDNLVVGNSTLTTNLTVNNRAATNTLLWNLGLGVSTISADSFGQRFWVSDSVIGATNIGPIDARIYNFSSIQSGTMSTIDIRLSTINGVDWNDISGGGGGTVSTFNQLFTSSIGVSSLVGVGFPGGKAINVVGNGLNFINTDLTLNARYISSLQYIFSQGENLDIQASTVNMTAPNYIRIGQGGAFDTLFTSFAGVPAISTAQLLANSTITKLATVSTLAADGGLPIKVANTLEFVSPNAVDNVDVINLNPSQIPVLNIGASTITLATNNTFTQSLSTARLSTSAFNFSSATCVGSNTLFNYPLFIEYDHAGATTAASGVAIAVQGHNLSTGTVRNTIEMGARANGECFIATSWPGQNLEDLYIDATDVIFRDGTFSTIINLDPYGLITTGAISAPTILLSSINGTPAIPAYGNFLTLSTMNLYAASTTLLHFSTAATACNIQMAPYDLKVEQPGVYKVGVSLQMNNQSGSDQVEFFFQKNNVTIDYSASIHTVPNNEQTIVYAEILEPMVVDDAIEIGMYTTSADLKVSTVQGNVAISPGAIITMYRVDTV